MPSLVPRPGRFTGPPATTDLDSCLGDLRRFFDDLAPERSGWLERNRAYHRLLRREYRFWITPDRRVLEVGCGLGDLLAAVEPRAGLGLDLSPEMARRARLRHPASPVDFSAGAVEHAELGDEPYDAIILSDLLGHLYDIRAVLERLGSVCHPRTRLVMNFHSRLWEPVFAAATRLGLKAPVPQLNWVTPEDVDGLLRLAGFEVVWVSGRILLPAAVPLLAPLANRVLAPLWPVRHLCVTNVLVARPVRAPFDNDRPPRVSVVVPCRNEAGNIPEIVRRIPKLAAGTEVLLVEGGSSDETWERCREQAAHDDGPHRVRAMRQTGTGKGDAVRLGFAESTGDVLMILDADMTVPPEDLVQFLDALTSGRVEFVNGSRLVYAMESRAMRWLNLVGNKLFAAAFTWLLGQRVKDTLCGTKVLLRTDYERIAASRAYFGEEDPFGDFDLLFGAAKLGLKIQDLPIRYRDRTYGQTNISRFRHGWLLVRMCWLALWRLKCR